MKVVGAPLYTEPPWLLRPFPQSVADSKPIFGSVPAWILNREVPIYSEVVAFVFDPAHPRRGHLRQEVFSVIFLHSRHSQNNLGGEPGHMWDCLRRKPGVRCLGLLAL